ncbi:hypothetical protein TNCV_4339081 [Trichonephila clavipes]|nr:hypothetical protein TNCV_4339081 [Trichonephila clavipes]
MGGLLPLMHKLPVNRFQDWNEVALSPNMSLDLSSMSLDPVLKLFLGDLCFIGPVQHVIGPVQHVIGPHVILPVQDVIGPVQHVIVPVQQVIGPVQHVILPVQHVIGPVQHFT